MKQITKEQRYALWVLLQTNTPIKVIATTLGFAETTIRRELHRNCDKRSGKYDPDLAQRKCVLRHKNKPKNSLFTPGVKVYVEELLQQDYSPEQIKGRAVMEGIKCVSHERIYQHVWADKKSKGILYEHLRRGGRKYKKRGLAKSSRGIIKNRIDISERPKIVDSKTRLGDLEFDTIIGQNHKGAILTINDRVSGYLWMAKLTGKDANDLADKAIEILSPHKEWIKTITSDNGKEFAKHELISEEIQADFYFARPYHSWERGANENTNGLIRQYFPKGSSFENITNEQILYVQHKLNNRPRKKLNFSTPAEFLSLSLLNKKSAFIT